MIIIKDKHTLTTKYLLINCALGLIFTAVIMTNWNYNTFLDGERECYFLSNIIISFILFTLSRFSIYKIALKFSTKKLWTSDFFQDDAEKNGVRAMFYMFFLPWLFRLVWEIYSIVKYKNAATLKPHKIRF